MLDAVTETTFVAMFSPRTMAVTMLAPRTMAVAMFTPRTMAVFLSPHSVSARDVHLAVWSVHIAGSVAVFRVAMVVGVGVMVGVAMFVLAAVSPVMRSVVWLAMHVDLAI